MGGVQARYRNPRDNRFPDFQIVIFYHDGTESAFRTSTRGQNYQLSGSTTVFSWKANGLALTFSVDAA